MTAKRSRSTARNVFREAVAAADHLIWKNGLQAIKASEGAGQIKGTGAAQAELARIASEYHWVASGRINIPRHTPQYKKLQTTLRKLGLKGPVKHLTLA